MTQRLHSRGRGRSLPEGYQFGDAAPYRRAEREFYARRALYAAGDVVELKPWRAPHLNAAEQLARRQFITDRDLGDEQ